MSLTDIIEIKEIKEYLSNNFPMPIIKFSKNKSMPQNKVFNYALVGIAFDYLLRFKLDFLYKEKIISKRYLFRNLVSFKNGYNISLFNHTGNNAFDNQYIKTLNKHMQLYNEYMISGVLTDEFLINILKLSKVDAYFRNGKIDTSIGDYCKSDVTNLRDLLVMDYSLFEPSEHSILNPVFVLSKVVNGADADLVIDNRLIDIKTTNQRTFSRKYFNQLIGYYLLFQEGGFRLNDKQTFKKPIKFVGIYYSRFKELLEINIDEYFSSFGIDADISRKNFFNLIKCSLVAKKPVFSHNLSNSINCSAKNMMNDNYSMELIEDGGQKCFYLESQETFEINLINEKECSEKFLSNLKLVPLIGKIKEELFKSEGYETLYSLQKHPTYRVHAEKCIELLRNKDMKSLTSLLDSRADLFRKYNPLKLYLSGFAKKENYVVLDIETLSLNWSEIILIGFLQFKDNKAIIHQYFACDKSSEQLMLKKAMEHIDESTVFVSYNGDLFDIPFLNSRLEKFRLNTGLQNIDFDLLYFCRHLWKDTLENCKLTTVARSLFGENVATTSSGSQVPMLYEI